MPQIDRCTRWELRWLERHTWPLEDWWLLDVGAGDGSFVEAARLLGGWTMGARGIDRAPGGPRVFTGTFPGDCKRGGNIITFRESLYYLDLPATEAWLRKHVPPGGYVYVKSVRPRWDAHRFAQRIGQHGQRMTEYDVMCCLAKAGLTWLWSRSYPSRVIGGIALPGRDRFMVLARKPEADWPT